MNTFRSTKKLVIAFAIIGFTLITDVGASRHHHQMEQRGILAQTLQKGQQSNIASSVQTSNQDTQNLQGGGGSCGCKEEKDKRPLRRGRRSCEDTDSEDDDNL